MMRCAWTGVTCNEVLTPKTPNEHGLSNNAVAAFRECPLIPPTVRTQRDGYAETESDQKPFLDAKKPTKNRKIVFSANCREWICPRWSPPIRAHQDGHSEKEISSKLLLVAEKIAKNT